MFKYEPTMSIITCSMNNAKLHAGGRKRAVSLSNMYIIIYVHREMHKNVFALNKKMFLNLWMLLFIFWLSFVEIMKLKCFQKKLITAYLLQKNSAI